jgi:predicted transcriptional regulator of viral defense system
MGKRQYTGHHEKLPTVGPQVARLLAALYDRGQSTFTVPEAADIVGLSHHSTSTLLHKAVERGVISRLKRDLFTIIPAELGSSRQYSGNPYVTALRLAGAAQSFVSHGTAMEIHRMVTQPQLVVYTSSTKRIANRTLQGTEFRFVLIKPAHFFGTVKHWATKQESVLVSDLERTVIDGLRQPEYCGGIAEVAKGLWIRRQNVQVSKLLDYAHRLGVGAVIRRLGYLFELYGLASESELASLRKNLTATYVLLDPILPKEGSHLSRWRLQVNIPPEELETLRGT